ncbi:MAG: N-acetyl-gamma-glutamyl-phosphate reductase [Flavobacteriales bacterium]|nr:N-acetyl-gamma-glutamyl-phosphate reductase [Flavobacteriales bacterium]
MAEKINIGIIGGAGYTGGELIRILLNHPNTNIVFVHSNSNAGNLVSDVHQDLLGDTDIKFTGELSDDIDALFLCAGHGKAKEFLDNNTVGDNVKIIDLSHDFRMKGDHDFVYGLPEMNKEAIKKASRIANPGCFATAIQIGLVPLAAAGKLNDDIHISAITGSTGAGQSLSATTHFSWRNNNLSVYKAFQHQHLGEIGQSLNQLQNDFNKKINFVPYRGDFTRGIIASTYLKTDLSLEEAKTIFKDYYKDEPYTHVSDTNIDLKQVINSNKGLVYLEKHDDTLLVISIIDNLIKGASGHAVQNMNLMFGLDEKAGLNLKTIAF